MYLKVNEVKYHLYNEGVINSSNSLFVIIKNNGYSMADIEKLISDFGDTIVVYDSDDSDIEYVVSEFKNYTIAMSVQYNIKEDYYKIELGMPSEMDKALAEMQDRLVEAEEAINFLLMGGDE